MRCGHSTGGGRTDLHVSLIGTPAEEGGGGKIYLLDAGVFDGYALVSMIHPGPTNSLYAFPYAVAHLEIAYTGQGAHAAAYPQLGRNAADAFTRRTGGDRPAAPTAPGQLRVHGIVTEAGTAANAIPERAVGHWYVRALSLAELSPLVERVLDCFRAGALATGCELSFRETSPRYAEFRNDDRWPPRSPPTRAALGRDDGSWTHRHEHRVH